MKHNIKLVHNCSSPPSEFPFQIRFKLFWSKRQNIKEWRISLWWLVSTWYESFTQYLILCEMRYNPNARPYQTRPNLTWPNHTQPISGIFDMPPTAPTTILHPHPNPWHPCPSLSFLTFLRILSFLTFPSFMRLSCVENPCKAKY